MSKLYSEGGDYLKFSHVLEELQIDVSEIAKSTAFSTFSIVGLFDAFYSGEPIFSKFDKSEQEAIVKHVIEQTRELGKEYDYFRIKKNPANIIIVASNTKDCDSKSLDEALCELFFIFYDALDDSYND